MKVLARSVLMLLALGFATFGDLLDSTSLNTVNWAIVAEDSDLDQTKCRSNSLDNVVLDSTPHLGGAANTQILPRLPDPSTIAPHKRLSVYRI